MRFPGKESPLRKVLTEDAKWQEHHLRSGMMINTFLVLRKWILKMTIGRHWFNLSGCEVGQGWCREENESEISQSAPCFKPIVWRYFLLIFIFCLFWKKACCLLCMLLRVCYYKCFLLGFWHKWVFLPNSGWKRHVFQDSRRHRRVSFSSWYS